MADLAAKPTDTAFQKRVVWPLNMFAALLLVFTVALSSPDAVTRLVTILCHTAALATSYFSLRRRFNVFGLGLLFIAGYFYAAHLIVILEKKA